MFNLTPEPTFKGTAKIAIAGQAEPGELKLVFKHKTKKEVKAFFERAGAADDKDADLMMEIIADWEDVASGGVAQKFTKANLAKLLENYHGAIQSIFDEYLVQVAAARRGN